MDDSKQKGKIFETAKCSIINALLPKYFQEPTHGQVFKEPKNDLEFAEILLKSDLAVLRFHEFSQSYSKVLSSVSKDVQSKIQWVEDFIRIECLIKKNNKRLADDVTKRLPEHKLRNFLTHILDSVEHPQLPDLLQITHAEQSTSTTVDNLLLFRKHLLRSNITQYDQLLKRVIEENLFSFDIQYNLPNDGTTYPALANLILERIKALHPKQKKDPLIPDGFLPSCFFMPGGYETKKDGHGVIYAIEKNSDETFNFIIVNTGEGSPLIEDDKTYDITYSGLTLEELSEPFFIKCLQLFYGQKSVEKMSDLLALIDGHLSKKGIKPSRGRVHSFHNGKKNCVAKATTSFNKYRLLNPSDSLFFRFKAFYTEVMIKDFKDLKTEFLTNHKNYPLLKALLGGPNYLRDWFDLIETLANKILAKRIEKAERVKLSHEDEVQEEDDDFIDNL